MLTVSDNRGATRRLRIAAIAAIAVIVAFIAVYAGQSETPQNSPTQVSAPPVAEVLGPGAWRDAPAAALPPDRDDIEKVEKATPPAGLEVSDNQELVVNSALLDVINYFLLEQQEGNPAQDLMAYLKSALPHPAFQQAARLVGQYQAYMAAHDNLLAVQNLGTQDASAQFIDLNRIANWSEQRDRLRRSMLGDQVTQAWYRNDDAQLKQLIDELRQKNEAPEGQDQAASSPDAGPRPPIDQHWNSIADEVQHNPYMQEVLNKAATSFSALAGQRRNWTVHYAAFAEAARPLYRNPDLASPERNLQVKQLLRKFFPSESDRQLAQGRWEGLNGPLN